MAAKSLSSLCLLCILSGIARPASAARLGEQQQLVLELQECEKGSFLSEQNVCLPCNCKGHADYCEDITGICINCREHSAGDFCERCEDGYMLTSGPGGRHICQPCACPLSVPSNNFAVHCGGADLRCKCQEGYAGHSCERCAPGYYGNPMAIGNSCKRCDCNGNSDPNLIFNECHNVTGHCQHCWGNTAGANCERCAPGFYGDAISAKDCRECVCNKCGTSSCDDRTGVCHCRPGVTGRLCDQCEEGYSGFSSCQGCRRCECGPASIRSTCHPLTHSCPCRLGASGRYCERCLPGYWDYSPSGCQKCDCESGHCDMHTGECLAEAATINLCNISCDECIWHLIGDLRLSNKTLDQLRVGVLNISTGAAANDRLKYYNYTAHRLETQFQGWRNKSSAMRALTGELEDATNAVVLDIKELGESESVVVTLGNRLDNDTLETFTLAEQLSTNLTDLNIRIEEMIHDWELYSVHQDVDPEVVRRKTEVAQAMVTWMRKLDLSPREPIATDESTEAHDLLRRIRQLEKKLMITDGRLPPVREILSRFSTKLSDARGFLQKAASAVQETVDKNRASVLKFQRNEVKQQGLTEDHAAVNHTLEAARGLLSDTETTVAEVDALAQNVTEYHAAIDGASQKLTEKTERLSLADRDLVQRADAHAQELERQADELEEDLRASDANGFVQRAISAANVYNNIVKYVNDANITSITTLNLSQRAEDAITSINTQLGHLVTQSDNVFKESVSLHSEQIEVESEVVDKVKYIEETKETMDKNSKKLAEIVKDIGGIQADRTPKRLEFTLEVAEGTLNRSAEVLQTVTPISSKVEEWAANMRNNEYSTDAYEQAVSSAGEAVENLNVLVPELLDKLKVVEEKKPVNNVTTNIMRIRELIAQARSVAKKVQVSMKFNGQSSVEVHPHSNLEELKTVTSISLFMRVDPDKDPIEDRFILYLGDRNGRKDYMGLAIKNDNLVYVYNLGGEDVEIPLGSKPVSQWPAVFNYIKVERLGRHGKVFLTIPSQSSTDEQKFIQKGEAPGTDSLFDIDPKDMVFFVGGVPPEVKLPPPLSLAPFVGCIELASLNSDVISLYNFKETHKMDVVASAPCPRYKLAFSQSRIASYLFDGTGYALINNMERRGKFGVVTRFDIAVRTVANNGVLFLMVNGDKFFLLELKNGFLRLMYDFGFSNGPKLLENNLPKLQINDARYHEVSVIYHQSKKVILLVDKSHVKSMENPKTTLPFSDIYIGGAPSSILKSRPELSAVTGLKGCVKGFQFQKKDFNLLEEPGTIGISSGCPEEAFMSRKAYFTGESYLGSTAKISPFDSFEGGLNFRTLQPSGLLFYHSEGSDEFSISLENGAVVLNCRGTRVKSHRKQYNDGRTHFLVASVNNQKYSLLVDDKDKQDKKRPASAASSSSDAATKSFYYGGSPSSSFKNFTGCISYAYINRQDRDIEPEDFQRYTEKVQTSLQDCPVQRPPAALLSRHSAKRGQPLKVTRDKSGLPQGLMELKSDDQEPSEPNIEPCYLSSSPRAPQQAFHYGGIANSRQHYADLPDSFSERSHFSLSLKTHSSFGAIFYVSDVQEDNFMALFLAHGKLVYTFNAADQRVKIKSEKKYNDGEWHDVIFIRDGSKGRLIIDGLTVLEDRVQRSNISWHVSSPLYVGGVPPGRAQKNIQTNSAYSFTGCLKNLELDGQRLSSVTETYGVTPCFEGVSEPGTYFSEEGGYVMLDESFDLGLRFELVMEVRPRVASGVLLHMHAAEGFFTMYTHQGAVVVLVNDGTHEFFTKVSPRQGLCAGNWHRITVIRDANVVQLNVGSEVNHVVGPLNARAADARKPVFIGGAPDLFLPESVPTRKAYVGCMRNLTINNSQASFSKAVLVSGAVSVGTCPAA
ncbi:laminin subunit alpha-4 [Seriola lalandi dorsalis]|uniref:Laminin subunit alpha 4 n=1 Tax=Seriola lalandi dorsalis TaxID=1841481 RepID=A0A3B4XMR1_SERLL|nr:laminin subunit alpha-4 [Seriola lalandi dorsalis]XP_056261643.1 laminin subunit alpha-4 [Seriola aureovittata]